MKKKEFTPNQLARLPEEGYWLQYPGIGKRPTAVCNMNGQLKYIHNEWGKEWCTLMWTCCFTKNQIAEKEWGETYEHYKTHEDLVLAHPELDNWFHIKAPNDN
jgi:hypothetical protein